MKDIKGYEGLYAITSCGKVWSYRSNKFLSPGKCRNGYLQVGLSKNQQHKNMLIHRLVAEAYIPNPENKPQVNHRDEVKSHNALPNLEWMTAKENQHYGTCQERKAKKRRVKVYCVELDKEYESITACAKELNLYISNVHKVCQIENRTTGGYHFRYVKDKESFENQDELS